MRKIYVLLFIAFAFSTAMAQENNSNQYANRHNRVTSATDTTYADNAWFDYFDFNYNTTTGIKNTFDVYPDSTLRDPSSGYISCHGLGMSFDPTDGGFYTGSSTIGVPVYNTDAYTLDSFKMVDKYVMNGTPGPYDSLIIDLIASYPSGTGGYLRKFNPPSFGTYTVLAADDTPREFVTNYMPGNFTVAPQFADDCWDSVAMPQMVRIAIELNAAYFADTSTTTGQHILDIAIPGKLYVAAGQKVEAYVHFKNAIAYPLGTLTTAANYYKLYAGDPTGTFPTQSAKSYQCGLISKQTNDYGNAVYEGHDLLLSAADLYNTSSPPTSPYGFEVPRFSFHVLYPMSLPSYFFTAHGIIGYPDSACVGAQFYDVVNGTSSLLAIKTYFGDGTSDSTSLVAGTGASYDTVSHIYSFPGTYTVSQVLYYNNIWQDSIVFTDEYLACSFLPILLYNDINGDCIKESTEPFNSVPALMQVDSNDIPVDTISVTSGFYFQAFGPVGTIYGFSIIPGNDTASCTIYSTIYDTITTAVTYPAKYYGLACASDTGFDLEVNAGLTCGKHAATGDIMINNNYCTAENAVVTMIFSPQYIFGSSTPAYTTLVGNTVTWDFSSLSLYSGEQNINFHLTIAGSTYLPFGDTINTSYMVTPVIGDLNPTNNYIAIVSTVVASYDPNQMTVSPNACIVVDTVTNLQYTINFVNTGNDTAFNISVLDTLPASVDPHSLKIVMASNTMNITMINSGGNNIVKFDFPAINLLDATVCPQCNGTVIFSVNTLPGLPIGTTIYNHAGVFFDDNPVSLTDTVEDIMGGCFANSVKNSQPTTNTVSVFPNPTTTQLTILMTQNAYTSFTITNSIGQEMIQQPLTTNQTQVNVATLPPGLYYITFRGDNGTAVQKFVKM